jgi:hypothetical protein
MKLSLPPKLVEKLVWVPIISLCKTFIRSYVFDDLLCGNWLFSPPNRETFMDNSIMLRTMQNSVSSKIHNFTAGVMHILASVGWAFDFVNNNCLPNSSSHFQQIQE